MESVSTAAWYQPVAGVVLILRRRVREGRDVLVHKGTKAKTEVAGDLLHLFGQLRSQVADSIQVVLHGQ